MQAMSQSPLKFLAIGLAALCAHGVAHAGGTLESQVAVCRSIAEPAQRLRCYDGIQDGTAAVPAPASPLAATPPASPAAAAAESSPPQKLAVAPVVVQAPSAFGSETIVKPIPVAEQKDLQAKVKGSVNGFHRNMVFELDNGQSWRDVDDRDWECEGDDPVVTITRNFAGSYFLQMAHCPYTLRVTRIN